MPALGSGEASHFGAESASRCTAGFNTAHTGAPSPCDPHPPFLFNAEGFRNSMSGVRHFSFDDGVLSFEARQGVAGKSGRSRSCASLLLPAGGASDCNLSSANWRSGISSVPPHLERGVGRFAHGVDFKSVLGRTRWRRFRVPNAIP